MEPTRAGSPGPDRDRALACLRRYVHASIAPADGASGDEWAAWYRKQRDRIVFVESTGFWWQPRCR